MAGGGKSGGAIRVIKYYAAIHFGLCMAGPGLTLVAMRYGEKVFSRPNRSRQGVITIRKRNLFGGHKREGGLHGIAYYLPGGDEQIMPTYLAWLLGNRSSKTCPAFRGLATIFFTGEKTNAPPSALGEYRPVADESGDETNNREGFQWSANNPYLRDLEVLMRRPSIGLNPEIAMIRLEDGPNGEERYGSNPAHVIFECQTNSAWGMGRFYGVMDVPSYERAAQQLYEENFGVGFTWDRTSKIEDVVQDMVNHVQASIFPNPRNGLQAIKLLRNDYDLDDLRVITPANARIVKMERKAWGEVPNEVTVTYTNPDTNKNSTVTAQDVAGVMVQRGVVNDARNYHAIRSRTLASTVAERELSTTSRPLATYDIEMNREGWDVITGEVVILRDFTQHGIVQAVVRVGPVNYGSRADARVRFTAYEDIFGVPYTRLEPTDVDDTQAEDQSQEPAPLANVVMHTAPLFLMAQALGYTTAGEADYPHVVGMILAEANGPDYISYAIYAPLASPSGEVSDEQVGSGSFVTTAALVAGLPQATDTLVTSFANVNGEAIQAGQFLLIGADDQGEEGCEIALVDTVTPAGWLLLRGMLDTTPRAWPSGTKVWVIGDASAVGDLTLRSEGETTDYRLLPQTSLGELEIDSAPDDTATFSARPYLPLRPANVMAGGVGFGALNAAGMSVIPITWNTRNRTQELTQALAWTDAAVAPEPGQTTSILLYGSIGNLIARLDGITGGSYDLYPSMFGEAASGSLKVISVKDGEESLQGHSISINLV